MESKFVNMLTAKKVKLHGMKSSKWRTKDKISQYKSLITLYHRNRKIIKFDTNVTRKKLDDDLKHVQKSIVHDRSELDNALRGNQKHLHNLLADHRKMQLAYQNSLPELVHREIDNRNFQERKLLDKLRYQKKNQCKKLTDLKLEKATLEDRLRFTNCGQIRQKVEAQIITGKVQDATLRREAAWAINHIYREILDIMKKDSLYFDAIIATVKVDTYSQNQCFLGAITLGQLATEHLDDRQKEYHTLEATVLKEMKTRDTDIQNLREQTGKVAASVKLLLRRDSDISTCVVHLKDSPRTTELSKDLKDVDHVLNFLKNTTSVLTYDQIQPCLLVQQKQKKRLKRLVKKYERNRESLLNRTNHAELMNMVLKTTTDDNTIEYVRKKQQLVQSADEINARSRTWVRTLTYKRSIAAKMRICLQHLLQLSREMKYVYVTKTMAPPSRYSQPEKEEMVYDVSDGSKITSILIRKYSVLMDSYFSNRKKVRLSDAFRQFELMMGRRAIARVESDSHVFDSTETDTSHVLSRHDIKKQSKAIVAANSKNEDLFPVFNQETRWSFSKRGTKDSL